MVTRALRRAEGKVQHLDVHRRAVPQEPIESSEDGMHRPSAVLIEHAERNKFCVRRDAPECAAVCGDQPGDEGPVT